jgi:hypothetical protein
MEKKQYEKIKAIRQKIEKSEPTTFAERNILNIYIKKLTKKKL